jgi:amino acid permease
MGLMNTAGTELFTRGEVLAGLPARRAQTALFLIESRTAHQVAQARQALEPFLGEKTAAERDLAYVEAFTLGKAPPLQPTIQDLETHVAAWRSLAPDSPRARAALAQLLGQKYRFTAAQTPGIRAALGLDEPVVEAAFVQRYHQPLATIYRGRPSPSERLRWARASLGRWFESLPPFWAVFALTLTETVGAGILALPIALAGIGPLPGIILLVILGLVNVLTIVAQAEAVARSGVLRYGHAFLGRMVEDYLGRPGARIFIAGNAAMAATLLLVYFIGFASTLAAATGVPAVVWAGGLLLLVLNFLRQKSLDATVTTALAIGGANLLLLLLLSLVALTRLQPANLLHMDVPLLNGRPFEASILGLIFGTVLGAFFGHQSVGLSARFALRRDTGARSLIWGVAAAQGVAIVLYSVWVLAINSAVAPERLAREAGTALIPLAAAVGPVVHLLGSLYVVLAATMAAVQCALVLFNLLQERLPRHSTPTLWLPRRQGRLILRPRRGSQQAVISLTYLGLTTAAAATGAATPPDRPIAHGPRPRFRVDLQQGETVQRVEIAPADHWDEAVLREHWPQLDPRLRLAVTVRDAAPDSVRLEVNTPLAVRYEGAWDAVGLRMADMLALPAAEQGLLTWIMRRGAASLTEIAAHAGQDPVVTQAWLAEWVDAGLLVAHRDGGTPGYRVQFALRRGRTLPDALWQALEDGQPPASAPSKPPVAGSPRWAWLGGPRTRFWLAISPTIAISLAAAALMSAGRASFSGPVSFIGVVVASLLAGIFPVLMLTASRRKGELVPAVVYRVLGQPWPVGGVYALFIAVIFLHGLVIWQDPVQRVCALLAGVAMIAATAAMIRQDVFAGRLIVELCEIPGPAAAAPNAARRGRFAITALGRPVAATVGLAYAANTQVQTAATGDVPDLAALRQVSFDLPATPVRTLKHWAHRVTADGMSESLPVVAEVRCGDTTHTCDLRLSEGQVVLPVDGRACQVALHLDFAEEA